MEKTRVLKLWGIPSVFAVIVLVLLTDPGLSQTVKPTTHTIFMAAIEIKGGTSADKLAPPSVNPKDLSKGYDFKAPGQADKNDPKRWEVSSYMFSPGSVAVRQGDTVKLTAFVVNGDEHHVRVNDPDGREVIAETKWNRGREYQLSFVTKKLGIYHLTCSDHAPTMAATILVLPRK
ncbi:MAG: hypothetical protein HY695_34360 [Deltaproteobacteria bacterium]|nr:hypothetical protein [Deltaproteobacteria bacterium]